MQTDGVDGTHCSDPPSTSANRVGDPMSSRLPRRLTVDDVAATREGNNDGSTGRARRDHGNDVERLHASYSELFGRNPDLADLDALTAPTAFGIVSRDDNLDAERAGIGGGIRQMPQMSPARETSADRERDTNGDETPEGRSCLGPVFRDCVVTALPSEGGPPEMRNPDIEKI